MRLREIKDSAVWDNKLLPMIAEQCSEFLLQLPTGYQNKKLLYRGLETSSYTEEFSQLAEGAFLAHSPLNRVPRDSSIREQELIDTWLKKHGFDALRSNSSFTSSSIGTATYYGPVYFIFPINGFKYTWYSNEQAGRDLWGFLEFEFHDANPDLKWHELRKKSEKEYTKLRTEWLEKNIDKFMKDASPRKNGLNLALSKRTAEIAIHGAYLMLANKYWWHEVTELSQQLAQLT